MTQCRAVSSFVGRLAGVVLVKEVHGGAKFGGAECWGVLDIVLKSPLFSCVVDFVDHVPVDGVVDKARRRWAELCNSKHPFAEGSRFFNSFGLFKGVYVMNDSGLISRIICILIGVMESGGGFVLGVAVAFVVCAYSAFAAGLWVPGESVQNIFPNRGGFRGAGVVAVQGNQGVRWVEAQQGGGAYTEAVGQASALSGEAVRLFADAKFGGGRGGSGVALVECCEELRGGGVHGVLVRQQGVDSIIIGGYRPVSSGSCFFSPPHLFGPCFSQASMSPCERWGFSFSDLI